MAATGPYAEAITVGDLLVRASDTHGDADALVFPGHRSTFVQLRAAAERVAAGLHALGVRAGDRVGILMPNTPDFAHCLFGASMLGAVVVPINARYRRSELRHVLRDSGTSVLLTTDAIREHIDYPALLHSCFEDLAASEDPLTLALVDAPALRTVVVFGTGRSPGTLAGSDLDTLAATVPPHVVTEARGRVRLRDLALLMYTSGTTADAKGCPITHESVTRIWLYLGRLSDVRAGDRFWVPMPMFHVSGLGPLLFAPALGATYVSLTHFEVEPALRQLREERPTHLWPLFPFVLMPMLKHPNYEPGLLAEVRNVNHNAPADTVGAAAALMPPHVPQVAYFGMTETAGGFATTFPGHRRGDAPDQVFRPIHGFEVRVADPLTGAEVSLGSDGELLVRGYSVLEGYLGLPDAGPVDDDDWLHTGDLVTRHPDGFTFVGRVREVLRVGGENVSALEIEAVLSTHADVLVAQVVGRDDERYGEVPVAFVELRPGTAVPAEELIERCRAELARWKVPREVRFVTEWPMSATKIQKNRLRSMLAE